MEIKEQYIWWKTIRNKLRFLAIFLLKMFQYFLNFFRIFLDFKVKYTWAIAIWRINSSFWGSYCIENDLKFWSPVNPGSLAWCTKALTTWFLRTFWSLRPINSDTVKLGKNESYICDQRGKIYFPTNFESIWCNSNFSLRVSHTKI